MPININIESVAFKAQGYEGKLDLTRCHDDSRDAMMEYGARRWLQDRTNSAAKEAREEAGIDKDAGVPVEEYFDAPAFVKGLIKDLEEGKVSQRGAGMTDTEKVMHQLARADWLATLSGDDKKRASKLLMGEIRAHMAKIVESDPDGYKKRAEAEIARRKALADEKAKNAAKAKAAVAKAGIDLDALLK